MFIPAIDINILYYILIYLSGEKTLYYTKAKAN